MLWQVVELQTGNVEIRLMATCVLNIAFAKVMVRKMVDLFAIV